MRRQRVDQPLPESISASAASTGGSACVVPNRNRQGRFLPQLRGIPKRNSCLCEPEKGRLRTAPVRRHSVKKTRTRRESNLQIDRKYSYAFMPIEQSRKQSGEVKPPTLAIYLRICEYV